MSAKGPWREIAPCQPSQAAQVRPWKPCPPTRRWRCARAGSRRRSARRRRCATCSFELRAGEVHCIVGENGSGKSTLVKILSGVHVADAGLIQVRGRALDALSSPRKAVAAGLATVFQEVLVVESRSVLENVWMGTD